MKHASLAFVLLAACTFNPDGGDGSDADVVVDIDAADLIEDAAVDASIDAPIDAGTDAALIPLASIVCSATTVDGLPKLVLTFSGDIRSGFLSGSPGSSPVEIYYGSNHEDFTVSGTCEGTWTVPYSSGCRKPTAVWGPSPQLVLEPEVDYLNVALRYADDSVHWGDLKTSDGDPVGFVVSGLDCRIELTEGGTGGYIRTHPNP